MTNLKTNESTLRAIRQARRPLSPEELEKQRVSFIMGSLNTESAVTRAKVREVLAEQEGRQAKK